MRVILVNAPEGREREVLQALARRGEVRDVPALGADFTAARSEDAFEPERGALPDTRGEELVELREDSRTLRRSQLHLVAGRAGATIDYVYVGTEMVAARSGQRRPREYGVHQFFFVGGALHGLAVGVEQLEFSPRLAVPNGELLFEGAIRRLYAQFKARLAARVR